jgi:hypothetical protein
MVAFSWAWLRAATVKRTMAKKTARTVSPSIGQAS